jgi:preprotein translocase subunit YajC
MNQFLALTTSQDGGGMSMILMLVIYAVFIAALYFIFFRPQNKKKKKEAEMRKNAQVGDEITTIGGICGRIVAVKDESDSVILETGSDKARIRVKRWAIGSVDTVQDEEPAAKKEEKTEEKK